MNIRNPIFMAGMLLVLLLSACSPAASRMPVEVEKAPTEDPGADRSASASPTPEENPVYPYYLPLATKPDTAPQTIDGVTAEIDWAYADESRVALQYTISGLDWPDGTGMDPMHELKMTSTAIPDLWMGAVSWNNSPAVQGVITGSIDQRLMDGALEQEEHPNIDLSVDIPVEGPTSAGSFHFDLDLPVLPGRKFEDMDQTVVANDVAVTLKDLRLTPSTVEALICFQMPSPLDWGLGASTVTVGERVYPFVGGGPMPGTDGKDFALTDPERCSTVAFDIMQDESAGTVTLTVPRLMGSIPEVVTQERVDRANQRLAAAGIRFQYIALDHGANVEILERPEGKTDPEIYPLIWEALSDQYEGPWVLTVPLKP